MALPKLGVPQYELSLPSTGKTVKYRPFLVKEEKVLLLALEGNNEKEVISAVKNTLRACVLSRVKVDELPSFDLEYLFLKIRAAAVGEVIEMTVTCNDDNETQAKAKINIDSVEVKKQEGHDRKIMLTDSLGIIMNYPSMDRFIESQFLNKDLDPEHIFNFIAEHIDQIFDGEEVYDSSTTTKKEFREFVESLTSKQFEAIQKFYETMPRLTHTFTVINPNTGNECNYTIEGLQSFFA
jgi:hypothetical protein